MAHTGHYTAPPNAQAKSVYIDMEDAFANLTMATTANKYPLSTLATTNAALTCQLATKDRLIANLQSQLRNANTNTNTNTDHPNTKHNY
jgi:hypothetical protein